MKKVGIIGGLGPETTAEFYLDIVFACYSQDKTSRPGILISSVPLPYEIEEDLIISGKGAERYIPFLIEEAKRLEASGVDFIVLPCNSLHIFIDQIREAIEIPVLSIVEETVRFIQEKKYKKVGIVSTSATIKNKLYEHAFKKAGISFICPHDLHQEKMGKIILNLVTGQQRNSDRESIIEIINSFEESGADCVALACTDLQLLIPKHPKIEVFDTMKVLSRSTVQIILTHL